MSAALNISYFGFDQLIAKLERMPSDIQREGQILIRDGAERIAAMAKTLAPVNFGFLKGGIYAEPLHDIGATVRSDANYSAYLEFGTGTKVDVPAELEEYALQFKGLKEVIGINPHPFFFPAVNVIAPSIIKDVEVMLQEVANR